MSNSAKKNRISFKDKLIGFKINSSVKKVTAFLKTIYGYFYKIFNIIGKVLAKWGVNANVVSIIGFVIGLLSINYLTREMYVQALICILINRAFDAIDGAIAKHSKVTDFGVFLDATLDYVFYAAVIFGFAFAVPVKNALAAVFLLFAFATSASAMLSFAVVAYKNKMSASVDMKQSPFYLGGWAQGFETLIVFVLMCLFPHLFVPLAILLGLLCFVKAFSVAVTAYYTFVIAPRKK